MDEHGLYKQTLLEHYRRPLNKLDRNLDDADIVRRGSNPRCGDEIEIGLYLQGRVLRAIKFRGRGCSVCIASTSMMTDSVSGQDAETARDMCNHMRRWFTQSEGNNLAAPPSDLQALSAVRAYPARRRCVMLAWDALADALDAM